VFTRIRGKVDARAGRYEADYEAMAAIKTIADAWGIAILVVHHTRKQRAEDYLDTVSGAWQLLEGPASDYDLTEQRRQIATAVRDKEGIGPKQIAEDTGLSHDVVKHLVLKMADDGTLDTDGSGRYFTPHSLRSLRSLDGGEQSEQGERGEGSP
jgi:hypothetical protein